MSRPRQAERQSPDGAVPGELSQDEMEVPVGQREVRGVICDSGMVLVVIN